MHRKEPLATGEYYHIYSRSIASFVVFKHPQELLRMRELFDYYRRASAFLASFSIHKRNLEAFRNNQLQGAPYSEQCHIESPSVQIIAYCLMRTHFHLILRQTQEQGISNFMQHILTSYSKFFNALHKRRGPLWESRFQSRHVNSNDYLLHLSRYIHLNPVKAGLTKEPQEWEFSSYRSYIGLTSTDSFIDSKKIICYTPEEYKKITEDHFNYQASLGKIKHLLIDNPNSP